MFTIKRHSAPMCSARLEIDIICPITYMLSEHLTQLVVLLGHRGHGLSGIEMGANLHLHLQGVVEINIVGNLSFLALSSGLSETHRFRVASEF